ncbi:PAS domain S-box protein [Haloarculaceae archaeon H-GB11]|nr:PAS domain S-box protein [Haloarculaceae archaeon H-GB11]
MKPSGPESDDEVSRRLDELERYEAMVETVPDGVYTLDTDLCFSAVNEGLVELTGYDRSELVGAHTSLLFEESVIEDAERRREYLREHPEEALTTQYELITASGEQVPVEVRFTARRSGGEYRGTVGVVRDVTHRLERERELRRQRDELERLDRINAVIRDVVNALAAATSRAEIDQAVCDRLAASEPYEFVWLVEFDDDDETVLRSWAGMEAAYFTDGDAPETFLSVAEDTCARALRTQSVETVQFTGDEATAVERGSPGADRAIAAVPLVNEGVEYGAIMIYAAHENAFDTRETAVLGELGATTSYAIAALEQETHSRTLTALQESTRELMHAESQADIAGAVAETAVSVLEFDGSVLYRFEQETGRLEPAASAGALATLTGSIRRSSPGPRTSFGPRSSRTRRPFSIGPTRPRTSPSRSPSAEPWPFRSATTASCSSARRSRPCSTRTSAHSSNYWLERPKPRSTASTARRNSGDGTEPTSNRTGVSTDSNG